MRPDRRLRLNRSGFSLIELLVVLTILLMLIGLIVSFFGTAGNAAREAATRVTITKLDALLQARYRQMVDSFAEQDRKPSQKAEWPNLARSAAVALTGTEPTAAKKAMVRINRYRGAFPQRKEDFVYLGGGDFPNPYATGWPSTMPVGHLPETESSELLYFILASGGGTGAEAQIADSINPKHIQDTDGDGLMEFVDDWGVPLRFYNSPTRLLRPNGAYIPGASAEQESVARALMSSAPSRAGNAFDFTNLFNQDPFDPKGALRATSPLTAPAGASDRHFYTNPGGFEIDYHTPDTFYAPLIVSCGGDEALGLGEPTATTSDRHAAILVAGEASDNITNLQSVGGGP
ncbi:hypothetical protein Pan44_36530 [Caulifigura coniformis]|uniref:Type II secretion system protein G n=1 Tax=Caulifigura coniformis TaxID=2527983 RepID=A0A517SHN6_9PLAN|nr:prepilin-type N-terminal cleavage/methylation domain-containing protein [Caulifigura coniformis]QDT55607.1 hypothetical protein Pan44_36530 [Caulifigura coniformis]